MKPTIRVIGVPTDYGVDRRGVDMGPSAIRYAGLFGRIEEIGLSCVDAGDLTVPNVEGRDRASKEHEPRSRYIEEVEDVTRGLGDHVASAIAGDELPLVLGGDHSIAIGTMRGASQNADLGVVWFDAHGDFNTPSTTPSGNVHGMALAAALGLGTFGNTDWAPAPGVSESNVVLVGLRDLDDGERELIKESDVTAYTTSDIDTNGISAVVEEALEIASAGMDGIHVSVDLDFLDPKEAPGVGTPVRGGATYREAHSAMEAVARLDEDHDLLRSMEFVEVNPILDERNETARLATELAASALGMRVL